MERSKYHPEILDDKFGGGGQRVFSSMKDSYIVLSIWLQ